MFGVPRLIPPRVPFPLARLAFPLTRLVFPLAGFALSLPSLSLGVALTLATIVFLAPTLPFPLLAAPLFLVGASPRLVFGLSELTVSLFLGPFGLSLQAVLFGAATLQFAPMLLGQVLLPAALVFVAAALLLCLLAAPLFLGRPSSCVLLLLPKVTRFLVLLPFLLFCPLLGLTATVLFLMPPPRRFLATLSFLFCARLLLFARAPSCVCVLSPPIPVGLRCVRVVQASCLVIPCPRLAPVLVR